MNTRILVSLALMAITTAARAQSANDAIAVNDEVITRAFVQAQVDSLITSRGLNYGGITQPDAFNRMQKEVVDQLIAQHLLWQEAKRREFVAANSNVDERFEQIRGGFDSPLAFQFKIEEGGFSEEMFRDDIRRKLSVQRMISEGLAPEITINDDEIEAFYNDNLEQMKRPPEVRARHILISPASSEPEAIDAARQEIDEILTEVKSGADFAAVAEERSQGPSSTQGGDLGYFGRGQMVPPFEQAAFALDAGEVSDVVQTQFGFHIIKLEDRRGDEIVALDVVSGRIRSHLVQRKLQEEIDTLVAALREKGDIEIYLSL